MLFPVTHSTHCVAECAKCGFSGQANTTLVQPRSLVYHHPIQYGLPNYIKTRARIRAGFLRTEIVLHTRQSPHTQHATALPFWLAHGDLLCNVGYGPMRNHIFPTQRLVRYSRTDAGKWGNSHANNAVKVLVMDVWLYKKINKGQFPTRTTPH